MIKELEHKITEQKKQLEKQEKIISALKQRVKNSIQFAGSAFSVFENNILLQEKIEVAIQEIEKSQSQYKLLFETGADAVEVLNEKGLIVDSNEAYQKLTGYTKNEIINQHTTSFWGEESKKLFENLYLRLKKQNYVDTEIQLIAKDGRIIDVWRKATAIFSKDNQFLGAVVYNRDITERKQSEQELLLANNIINRSTTVVFLWKNEKDWPTEFVSKNVKKLTGYTSEEFIKGKISYVGLIHSDDRERVIQEVAVHRKKEGAQMTPHKTYRIISKKGAIKWIDVKTYLRKDSKGIVTHHEGIVNDITKRIKTEEKLKESEQNFETILNASSDIIFMIDKFGKGLYFNKQVEKLVGYTPDYLTGKSFTKFVSKSEILKYLRKIKELFTKGRIDFFESQVLHSNGTEVPVELAGRIIKYKGKTVGVGTIRDITGRKQAEVELKNLNSAIEQSEHNFKTILNASLDVIFIVDKFGKQVYFNEQVEKLLGYKQNELIGKTFTKFVPKSEIPKYLGKLKEVFINKKVNPFETIAQKRNGEELPVEITGRVIKYNGKIAGLGSMRDISYRKEAEDEIKKLNSAINQSSASIVITDLNGMIQYVNPGFTKITGYSFEEAIGQNPSILSSGNHDDKFYQNMWDTILAGKTWKGEIINRKKNRELYWENASISPVVNENGESTSFVAVKTDITEKKKSEKELELLNQLVYSSLESADVGAWWIDYNEEDTFYALDTTAKLIGLPINSEIDKSYKLSSWLKLQQETAKSDSFYAKKIEDKVDKVDKVLSGELDYYSTNYPILRDDGSVSWINERADVTNRDENGKPLLMVGTIIDITEIKKIEQELLIANEQAKFALIKEKELSKLKSNFVSMTSHEFRTPLAAINFAAGSVKKYWDKLDLDSRNKKLDKIENQVNHMTRLLDDILTLGKAGVDTTASNIELFNFNEFIQPIIEEVYIISKNTHKITLINKNADTAILIDQKLGRNIFINLLNNAIKFSPGKKEVIIEVNSDDKMTQIKIIDFGYGIKEENLENIFTPFYREENVESIQGTGLGLSIVKDAIRSSKGTIKVESIVDKGTTFIINFLRK